MKNILIYPHCRFDNESGGVVVHYELARLLDEYGAVVRIHPYYKNDHIDTPFFTKYYNDDFPIDDNCVVIYCEGVQGNPLNAKNIVRWMLSELGKMVPYEWVNKFGKNELVYYFNAELKHKQNEEKMGNIYKFLTTIYVNPEIKNLNYPNRNECCHTFRKSHIYHNDIKYIHPPNSTEIIHNTKNMKIADIIKIFNNHTYFISYDPITFLFIMSALCGCVTIIYPIKGKTKKEWLQMNAYVEYMEHNKIDNIYGIAYGLEDIEWAKNTIHLAKDQFNDILSFYNKKHIPSFIEDINNFDSMINTIENNYFT